MIDGLVAGDRDAVIAVVDRDFGNQALSPDSFGTSAQALAQLLSGSSGQQRAQVAVRDLGFRTEPRRDSSYSDVFVSGRISVAGRDTVLDNARVLTAQIGERWYVTGPGHPYWKAALEGEQAAASQPPPYVVAEQDASPALPGAYFPPHPGPDQQRGTADDRTHVANGVVIPICTAEQGATPQLPGTVCYSSNPPTSGPHAQSALNYRVYDTPVPKENLVHNMEHGAVIIWYNSTDLNVINQLAGVTTAAVNQQQFVLMTPYAGMEPDTIALTSWTRLDKFPASQLTGQRVLDFIRAHHKRYNPEGF